MSTPTLPTYLRDHAERRELRMQTAFPGKVVSWDSSSNVVRVEPQFVETWFTLDGDIRKEEGRAIIDNIPVLFPRNGQWAITYPIQAGSFGLVTCTKYSLDAWRSAASRTDPGDLRRFTMAGAVFHPVNLSPDKAELVNVDPAVMEIGRLGVTDFVAMAQKVDQALTFIRDHVHPTSQGPTDRSPQLASLGSTSVGSTSVKVSV